MELFAAALILIIGGVSLGMIIMGKYLRKMRDDDLAAVFEREWQKRQEETEKEKGWFV